MNYEKNTSPNLDDLLELSENKEDTELSRNTQNNNTASEMSIDDLLEGSDTVSSNIQETTIASPLSTKDTSKTSEPEKISLDDLLGSENNSQTSVGLLSQEKDSKKTDEKTDEKNIFHQTFKEESVDDSTLLDQVENYSEEKTTLNLDSETEEEKKEPEDPLVIIRRKIEETWEKKINKFNKFLTIAQSSIIFGIISISAGFILFSFLLDTPSHGILGNIVKNNYGIDLEHKKETLQSLKQKSLSLKKDIKHVEKVIKGFKNNELLSSIIEDRIDWMKLITKVNEVRCYADPDSDVNQCKEDVLNNSTAFNPFTFDNYTAKESSVPGEIDVTISGKVYGSQGYIFQKMARLTTAFNNSQYFSGAEKYKYSKSQDPRLGFTMPFSLKITYFREGKGLIKDTPKKTK